MHELAVVVPTLNRPHAIQPLVDVFKKVTLVDHHLIFIADEADEATHEAVTAAGATLVVSDGSYPIKVNIGVREAKHEPLILIGGDDIRPRNGWLEAAKEKLTPGIGVVSTNDMGNRSVMRGTHATLPLVTQDYVKLGTIDEPDKLYHEGYKHCYCDWEFSETARHRNAFAYASDAKVEHLHPDHGKAAVDDTYLVGGLANRDIDKQLWRSRQPLWGM